jgi:AcrR family transcriptional regulator
MAQSDRAAARRSASRKTANLNVRIVDTAIELAEESGWESLRLRRVAERLGVPLAEVLAHYRDLDAVADAWFARAWAAMLGPPPRGFATRPARERVHMVMMRWFDALAGHRRVTGEMLSAKLYPSHPHHWVPMIFNLSRTIHWLREAAMLDATGRRRQMEEVGLTGLFLATLRVWLRDDSEHQARTRDILRRRLAAADRVMARRWGAKPPRRTA